MGARKRGKDIEPCTIWIEWIQDALLEAACVKENIQVENHVCNSLVSSQPPLSHPW